MQIDCHHIRHKQLNVNNIGNRLSITQTHLKPFLFFALMPLANSIKVELYSDEDPGRSTEDERVERVEEGGPEQGSDKVYREANNPDIMPTGATRMPNGKLKCDICGMICIGPNVLMVHKRSHTGEETVYFT